MYIVIAILLFGFLIAAHEWGHFIAARLCNVTVHEFSIGMGPAILKRTGKKGTVFSLRILPMGGYCAMEGEEIESDDPNSLQKKSFWQKILIFAAGAFMNFLVGVLILFCLNMNVAAYRTTEITGFAPEFQLQGENGLLQGDVLYSIDGERIYTFSNISMFLSRGSGEGFDLVVLRDGAKVVLNDFPMKLQECTDSESGTKYTGYGLYFGGIQTATFIDKLEMTWLNAVDFVRIVRYSIQELILGNAGVKDLSGPVGIVTTINDVGNQSASVGMALENIAYFGAMIAVNLAVMNLLPIPALDGGHILFLCISSVIRFVFRKEIPIKYENTINIVFFVILMALMLFVTFNDVLKLFG